VVNKSTLNKKNNNMKTKKIKLQEFKSLIKQIIKEESEYKFDNMVTAFVDEYAIHFVESPEEEAMMIYVVKNGNNIKIKNIEAGFDMKIKPEQYKDYEIKINEMYRKGEIKLPDSFYYNIKDNDITNIDWF
jgi:6-phosphogluconolactonase/glucosamine-6-phosphate isomerase/deaminase